MTVKMNTAAVQKQMELRTGQLLVAAAIAVQSDLKRSLSTSYPPASKPGEFPHWRTGNLRESVMYDPTDPKKVGRQRFIRIGYATRAPYGAILELFRKRLGVRETVKRLKSTIEAIVARIPS